MESATDMSRFASRADIQPVALNKPDCRPGQRCSDQANMRSTVLTQQAACTALPHGHSDRFVERGDLFPKLRPGCKHGPNDRCYIRPLGDENLDALSERAAASG